MSGNTIEAKLRIAAEVAQAITRLRELKREVLLTGEAVDKAGTGTGGAGAATANRQQATQDSTAAKAAAAERQAARQAERQAERAANAERVAADREVARQRRAALRAEADETAKLRKAQAAADGVQTQQQREAQRRVRAEANLQTNALRQLPAQVTDIVTGLTSGQAPLTVLIQQGGQLRDSFGSAGGALRALLGLLTPARVLIGGVAAAIAGVALAASAGYREQDRLNKALVVTGDAGRATLGQIDGIARRVSASSKTSIGDVRETLQGLVDAGVTSERTLSGAGRAATAYRKITGASAEEAVKLFAGQSGAVLDWATKANKAYNFLTAAQLAHIRNLQAQGRDTQAAQFANDELAKSMEQRAVPAVGTLGRAWGIVAEAVGRVVDSYKALGRELTVEEKITAQRAKLETLIAGRNAPLRAKRRSTFDVEIAAAQAELDALVALSNADAVRRSEKEAAQKAEQETALRASKAFVDAEIAVLNAGLQKKLATTMSALDRERDAVAADRAQELISETQANVALQDIERRRLLAQADTLRDRLGLEVRRKPDTQIDIENNRAAVTQLEAQLVEIQSRITQAGGEVQNLLYVGARQQTELWEKAWNEAAERISQLQGENASAANARIADPLQRAREAARLAGEELRGDMLKQAADLQKDLRKIEDPARAQFLRQQIDSLREQGDIAVGERRREAGFQSLQESLGQQIEAQRLLEQDLGNMVDQGALGTEEAEKRKIAARAASETQLRRMLRLLEEMASTPAERAKVEELRQQIGYLTDLRGELEKTAKDAGVKELAQGLTDLETGAKSAGEALRDMVTGFARALLNVLNQRLAEQLVDSFIKAIPKGGGGGTGGNWLSTAASFVASFFHTGGVIGSGAGRVARVAMPLALAGAQVLHNGGLVLQPNERAVVAEVGEEMLTADDPRHMKNFRGAGVTVNAEFIFEGGGGSQEDQRADAEELLRRMRMVCEQYVAEQMRQGGRLSGVRRG